MFESLRRVSSALDRSNEIRNDFDPASSDALLGQALEGICTFDVCCRGSIDGSSTLGELCVLEVARCPCPDVFGADASMARLAARN